MIGNRFQDVELDGASVRLRRRWRPEEIHAFATPEEAAARAAVIEEALSWIGTPFLDCARVKGPKGGVDCAMFAHRAYTDAGVIEAFDAPKYSPDFMRHHSAEILLEWIKKTGARQVEKPRLASLHVWLFGRCFSHVAIQINSAEVVHAFKPAGMVTIGRPEEEKLRYLGSRLADFPRPVQFFDLWSS